MEISPVHYVDMPSGLILPETVAFEELKKTTHRRPTAVDLFSGCGGFSLGLIGAGFEVVCAVDNDAIAAITYLTNLGQWPMRIEFTDEDARDDFERVLSKEMKRSKNKGKLVSMPVAGMHRPADRTPVRTFIFGDIRKVTGDMIAEVSGVPFGELDLMVGSPPCQSFSNAGRRESDDPRGALVFEMSRLIVETHPKTFMMENVPGIMSMTTAEGMPVMEQFMRNLEAGGYASYDALRKMLSTRPEAAAAFKGAKFEVKDAAKGKTGKADPQHDLFGGDDDAE